MAISALADNSTPVEVKYYKRSWNGTSVTSAEVTENITPVPDGGAMTSGKYFLNRNITVKDRINLTGSTELILGDGFTLDVKGIYVPARSTLTIYGQYRDTGSINSHPSTGSGIGGKSENDNGSIVIHGGIIKAVGADHCAGIGSNDSCTTGNITIYGAL